jgi:hypothetical protein
LARDIRISAEHGTDRRDDGLVSPYTRTWDPEERDGRRIGMKLLRRMFGGTDPEVDDVPSVDPAELEDQERQHELQVLRADHERLDELQQRQLRFAKYSWQPPAQGGDRRADDEASPASQQE